MPGGFPLSSLSIIFTKNAMSALQVYLNWANSVLSDCDPPVVATVDTIRQGKVICRIIETFWNAGQNEGLQHWELVAGSGMAIDYIQAVLCHFESQNIKANFTAEDILKGDIKSILDLLWLLILNYNIHDAGTNEYHQCSVGAGRRNLLAWCQNILAGLQLDKRCSLVKSLCTNDGFLMLLESTPGLQLPAEDLPTKSQHLSNLLENIESQFGIKKDILSVPELIAGTIDEQILMIYLALLKWKIENKQTKLSHQHLSDSPHQQTASTLSLVPAYFGETRHAEIKAQTGQTEKPMLPQMRPSAFSAEKGEVEPSAHVAPSITGGSFLESGQGENSIITTQVMIEESDSKTATPPLRSLVRSFSFHSDIGKTLLENDLSPRSNNEPYRSPVNTRIHPHSIKSMITRPIHQDEIIPNDTDFRTSPSLFSRPESLLGSMVWSDIYNDVTSTDLRPPYSSPSISDMLKSMKHVGDSVESGVSHTENVEVSQRTQEAVKQSDDGKRYSNLGQKGTPLTTKDSKDGMYSFKKVIIKNDGEGATINEVHMVTEKNDHLESTVSLSPSPTNIRSSKIGPHSLSDKKPQHTIINSKTCMTSHLEGGQPSRLRVNAPPTKPPVVEIEQFPNTKSPGVNDQNGEQIVDANKTGKDHASQSEISKQTTGNRNESEATEKKMTNIVTSKADDSAVDSPSSLGAASMTSRKIDILCIEIGELKKKVMAMETGRTSLEDLNRTFQSTMDSNQQIANHSSGGQRSRELGRGSFSKRRSQSQDSMSETMNQSFPPTANSLLDFERNELRKHSFLSMPADLTVNCQKESGNSLKTKETVTSSDSPTSTVLSDSSKEKKEHLWKCGNKETDEVVDKRKPLFMERPMNTQNRNDFFNFAKPVGRAPKSPLAAMKANHQAFADNKKGSIHQLNTEDQTDSFNKSFTHKSEGFSLDTPSDPLLELDKENREIDDMLFGCAPERNLSVSRMCAIMRQLKQENNSLKDRLQQEIIKMKMLDEDLQGTQNQSHKQCEQDSERTGFELSIQQNQTRLQQENVELRERLRIAEELNEQLKADVLSLQQYKTEIQSAQQKLREKFIQAEMDKRRLSEELNLLWRQRKALRQSNYEAGTKKTRSTDTEDVSSPSKTKASLVEGAFSNRLHQTERKSSSPLTSSPAGQKLPVAPFPVSPVFSNNTENQSPDCMFNRHGFGIFYPETPKTYRTISHLERDRNCLTSKKRHSSGVSLPRRIYSMDSDLELEELLDVVEGNSIAYGEDFDDDSDDFDKDAIQLQKRSRLYWSDEDLSRRSKNESVSFRSAENLDQNCRSSSDLHLSQTTAMTPQNGGRRRMNNVTFNLSNSVDHVPSRQGSSLRGILKKTSSLNQCNTKGSVEDAKSQTSTRSKTPFSQGTHYHSSEDLLMEKSQQDFLKPPNFNKSNPVKVKLTPGIGKRWSSHESLNSKYPRQKDVDEFSCADIFKSPPVNANDINFSFNDQIFDSLEFQHQNEQSRTHYTNTSFIENCALFRHPMREDASTGFPESTPLFGDPKNSMWSFTPYNFYMEAFSKHLNGQNRCTKDAKRNNFPSFTNFYKTTTKEKSSSDVNAHSNVQESTLPENSSPVKNDAEANSVGRSTPANTGPSTNSAGSDRNQKFSSVLSPEQVQFSPPTEAERQAIVRNLCSVFENSDLSIDGSEPGSAKKSRTWHDLDKNSPAQLTDEQRVYANTLIEKYTRLPTENAPKSAV